ncbi:MAG: hypothetical protein LBE15_00195 [Burkholderiales bacterium]|jgi:hypothetical protein|nr:hypothetical protein [Burkholderiales bacterium]
MKNNPTFFRYQGKAAFSKGGMLLEVLVAILILAFGILGLIGLQSRALAYVDESGYRSSAVYLAGAYASELWAVGANGVNPSYSDDGGAGSPYGSFKDRIDALLPRTQDAAVLALILPNGRNPRVAIGTTPEGATMVTIEIFWLMPGDGSPADLTAVHRFRKDLVLGFNP